MKVIKPLAVIFRPRDIPECLLSADELPCDQLWMNYFPQEEAYIKSRLYFIQNLQYTHFVIIPDDLIVNNYSYYNIIETFGKHPYMEIVSGWCNNTAGLYDDEDSNISIDYLSDKPPRTMEYKDLGFEPIQTLTAYHPLTIQAKYSGFAMTFISRKIIENVPFRADAGCCVDICLALDLDRLKIPQYVDTRARMTHLRTKKEIIQVGKKTPLMNLVTYP